MKSQEVFRSRKARGIARSALDDVVLKKIFDGSLEKYAQRWRSDTGLKARETSLAGVDVRVVLVHRQPLEKGRVVQIGEQFIHAKTESVGHCLDGFKLVGCAYFNTLRGHDAGAGRLDKRCGFLLFDLS